MLGRNSPPEWRAVASAVGKMRHRGPDGLAVHDCDKVILGHSMLAILDSEAKQPMVDADLAITFNGEIYNWRELRTEIPDYPFKTKSDTEVILALWKRHGPACISKLYGMFAFALWDGTDLYLVRDRLGIKPLYWTENREFVAFTSELKAMAAFLRPSVDPAWVGKTDDGGENTWFPDVKRIQPGHYVRIAPDGVQTRRWFEPEPFYIPPTFDEQVYDLSHRLGAAIERRHFEPSAISLSGGLDSAVIAGKWVSAPCYTVRYVDGDNLEQDVARQISASLNTEHNEIEVSDKDVADNFEKIVLAQEDAGPLFPAQWFHYRRIKERVVVDGHGADECLGGYPILAQAALNDPNAIRADVAAAAEKMAPSKRMTPYPDDFASVARHLAFNGPLQTILRVHDAHSMAHGKEMRAPLLDWRVFGWCLSLPVFSLYHGGMSKAPLRALAKQWLKVQPSERKVGFRSPMKKWLNGALGDRVRGIAEDRSFRHSTFGAMDGPVLPRVQAYVLERQL